MKFFSRKCLDDHVGIKSPLLRRNDCVYGGSKALHSEDRPIDQQQKRILNHITKRNNLVSNKKSTMDERVISSKRSSCGHNQQIYEINRPALLTLMDVKIAENSSTRLEPASELARPALVVENDNKISNVSFATRKDSTLKLDGPVLNSVKNSEVTYFDSSYSKGQGQSTDFVVGSTPTSSPARLSASLARSTTVSPDKSRSSESACFDVAQKQSSLKQLLSDQGDDSMRPRTPRRVYFSDESHNFSPTRWKTKEYRVTEEKVRNQEMRKKTRNENCQVVSIVSLGESISTGSVSGCSDETAHSELSPFDESIGEPSSRYFYDHRCNTIHTSSPRRHGFQKDNRGPSLWAGVAEEMDIIVGLILPDVNACVGSIMVIAQELFATTKN